LARPGIACRDAVASCARTGRGFGSAMAPWFGGLSSISKNQANSAKTRCWDISATPRRSGRIATLAAPGVKQAKRLLLKPRARHRMRLISAIFPRGHMRFGPTQKGGVTASVFIAFLKRLIAAASHVIFLIVDRGPAHIARKTSAFVESPNRPPRLFYLPPYSPDRNPDALGGSIGRSAPLAAWRSRARTISRPRSVRPFASFKTT
jgi:DDE superfamily endonuclease